MRGGRGAFCPGGGIRFREPEGRGRRGSMGAAGSRGDASRLGFVLFEQGPKDGGDGEGYRADDERHGLVLGAPDHPADADADHDLRDDDRKVEDAHERAHARLVHTVAHDREGKAHHGGPTDADHGHQRIKGRGRMSEKNDAAVTDGHDEDADRMGADEADPLRHGLQHGDREHEADDVHDEERDGNHLAQGHLLAFVEFRGSGEHRMLCVGEHEDEHRLHAQPGERMGDVDVHQARQVCLAVARDRLLRRVMRGDGAEAARLPEKEGGDDIEEEHEADTKVNQSVVPEHGTDHIREHAEHARDRLHPCEPLRAGFPLRSQVRDDRAGRVEADIDGEIEGEGDDDGGPKDLDAGKLAEFAEERQRQEHQRRRDAADEDERAAPSAPKPDLVTDQSDNGLGKQAGEGTREPHEPDVLDGKFVFCAEDPAEGGNLHAQREAHGCRGQAEENVERISELVGGCHF